MVLNLEKTISVSLDEIENDIHKARTERKRLEKDINISIQTLNKNIKFAEDFRKKSSIKCKRKSNSKKKKREAEKKRRERLAKEQAQRNRKACRYSKEMRNRDAIRKTALSLQSKAVETATTEDDKLIQSAFGPSYRFDSIIYNTPTSDVEDLFTDIFDDIDDAGDID